MKDIIDLGDSYKFNIEDEWYKKFCNQVAKEETRTPLQNKTKNPPFGTEVFKNRSRILKIMIGLTIQETYKDNPDQLKMILKKLVLKMKIWENKYAWQLKNMQIQDLQ